MILNFFKKSRWVTRRSVQARGAHQNLKKQARNIIIARLEYYSSAHGYSWNKVAIRDQRRRWGSCSSLGNLNFNYRLIFLPDCLRDYIIIHELCHLKQLNHSSAFWAEVARHCPDYQQIVKTLRQLEKDSKLKEELLLRFKETHSCSYCSLQQSIQ